MRYITIISGFSGTGKSSAAKTYYNCIDMESSEYSKEKGVWPYNYVDAIEENMERDVSCIFVSCHKEVRDEMTRRGLPYIIVCPTIDQKNEYIRRWFCRGSEIKFIKKMNNEWEHLIYSCIHSDEPCILLSNGEFISNLIEKINENQMICPKR